MGKSSTGAGTGGANSSTGAGQSRGEELVGGEGGRTGRESGNASSSKKSGCPYGKKQDGSCATKEERDSWNALKKSSGLSAADLAKQIDGNKGGSGGSSGGSSGGGGNSRPSSAPATPAPPNLDDTIATGRAGLVDEFRNYGIDLGLNGRGDAQRFGWQGSSYNDQIDRYLSNRASTVLPGDANPSQYFNAQDMFKELQGQIVGDTTSRLRREFNDGNGIGSANQLFGDDFGKQYSDGLVDSQFGDAQGMLDRSLKRGTLTSGAYDRAVSDLTGSRSDAFSRADTYRAGVLGDTRQQYTDESTNALAPLGQFKLGGSFDSTGAQSQLDNKFNTLSSGFEGSFNNAVGGEKFFDFNTLIGEANANQPAENSKFNAPLWLKAKAETDANNDQFRGLGTTGGF